MHSKNLAINHRHYEGTEMKQPINTPEKECACHASQAVNSLLLRHDMNLTLSNSNLTSHPTTNSIDTQLSAFTYFFRLLFFLVSPLHLLSVSLQPHVQPSLFFLLRLLSSLVSFLVRERLEEKSMSGRVRGWRDDVKDKREQAHHMNFPF